MRTTFNEEKAAEAAAKLLEYAGGRMSYMKLIKLLYVADRIALVKLNRPITGDDYYSMKQGPVLSTVLNLVKFGEKLFPVYEYWVSLIEKAGKYEVRARQKTDAGSLSEAELDILKNVHRRFHHMNQWDLVEYLHKKLKEWTDPGNSCTPITHEAIFRAAGKSEDEIRKIREEVEHVDYVHSVLNCR